MKKILTFVITLAILAMATIVVGATDTTAVTVTEATETATTEAASESTTVHIETTEAVTESITESAIVNDVATEHVTTDAPTEPPVTNVPLDSEVISEVIDIIESSDSKAEAVLAVVELLGVSTEEAEDIINALIAVGDEYLGQSDAWVGFKKDVQENMKFWAVVIACLASVITIAGVIFVFIARVNPELARSMFGTAEALKICKNQTAEITDSLGAMVEFVKGYSEKEEAYNLLLAAKDEQIQKLIEEIKKIELESEKARRNMEMAETYNLQILKLICARSQMPLSDKATIDLWYTKATEALEGDLSEDDVKKIRENVAILEDCHG